MIKLHTRPNDCSMSSHILLEEIGIPYEIEHPPYGVIQVPILELEDGYRLTKNTATLTYIGDLKPEKGLMGRTLDERAKIIEWIGIIDSDVHPAWDLFYSKRASKDPQVLAEINTLGREKLISLFQQIDDRLAGRKFSAGDQMTAADPYIYVVHRWVGMEEVDFPTHLFRHYAQFVNHMQDLESVKRVLKLEGLLPINL